MRKSIFIILLSFMLNAYSMEEDLIEADYRRWIQTFASSEEANATMPILDEFVPGIIKPHDDMSLVFLKFEHLRIF